MESKINIKLSFYIFIFVLIYFNGFKLFFAYFLALFLHEYSHYFVSKRLGFLSQSINIYPFGLSFDGNIGWKNTKCKIVYFVGPFVNIVLLMITLSLFWMCPVSYFYLKDFALANAIIGLYNLIPLYPLDGGNLLLSFFKDYKSQLKILKIMKNFCIIFGLFFIGLFFYSCFFEVNFSCFCMGFFLLSNIFEYKNISYKLIENKINCSEIRENKIYVININTKYNEIEKCFSDDFFVQFYLVNNQNKIIKICNQDEIKKMYLK